ncbi:MAG: hypothetical protein ACYSP9_02880 [Planctomycetota bacterium]|jgi:hypothetical protein
MIAADPNSTCGQAQAYYYDYLSGDAREGIPAEIAVHVDRCGFCRGEVDRLRIVLADGERRGTENAGQTTSAATTNLRLQFAYTGASVTCSMVKPFLPSLVIPALEVGVPTPITVHIDKCQQCADGLEAIRRLNLTDRQLCRLSQLFADEPSESGVRSRGHFHTEPATEADTEENIACDAVSAGDIFDYCFPYGTDPANDEYAKLRPTLVTHLAKCPTCQGKMQQLHRTVCSIAERPDSEVATRFTFEKQISEGIEAESLDLYADWPINVQVLDKSGRESEVPVPTVWPRRDFKQRLSVLVRPLIKPAAAAAAIVLVALLLFSVPVAKAVGLGQIYEALGRIKNVHFASFDIGSAQPSQQIWVSQTLSTTIFRTDAECVLWDIGNSSRKSKDLNTGAVMTAELETKALVQIDKMMKAPWGLLPFDDLSKVPPDAKWQRVPNEGIETTIPGTKVYDLAWTEKSASGSAVYRKWRGYVDAETRLPKRIEWWMQTEEGQYQLLTVKEVTYLSADQIRTVIKDAGF